MPPRESAPSLWVGGNTRPALRRALRHGDGWHGFEVYPEDMPGIRDSLAELGDEVGRDPGELELSVVRGMVPPELAANTFTPERRNLGDSAEEMVDELGRVAEVAALGVKVFAAARRHHSATTDSSSSPGSRPTSSPSWQAVAVPGISCG